MAVKPKQLLVEGQDDLFAVVGLMEHRVAWPREPHLRPVHIVSCNGAEEMLAEGFISNKLKESGLKTLSILLDANGEAAGIGRWPRLHALCSEMFPDMPAALPARGSMTSNEDGQRLGVWIMPDNISGGMLETFLKESLNYSGAPH